MGNSQASTEKIEYLAVDMPGQSSGPEPLTLSLRTISIFPKSDSTPSWPKNVLMKLHLDRAEFFDGDSNDRNATPIERWSFCNIASWGYNKSGISILVLSEQIMSAAACRNCARTEHSHQRRAVRGRLTYSFATAQGAEIAAIFNRIAAELAAELQEANIMRKSEAGEETNQRTEVGISTADVRKSERQAGLQRQTLRHIESGTTGWLLPIPKSPAGLECSNVGSIADGSHAVMSTYDDVRQQLVAGLVNKSLRMSPAA